MTEKELNPYRYSDTNKRYMTFDYYTKHRFGGKVAKISLDGGFTCPNIERGGGCIYCLGGSSGAIGQTVSEQYMNGRERISEKWSPIGYIPYLQAHTNTYAEASVLRRIYAEAASLDGAVMLAVATRADCLPDYAVAELKRISEKLPLLVELGLQSSNDATAEYIGRGHTYADFTEGYNRLRRAGGDIQICVHMIVGLPGESREDAVKTARDIAALNPDMIKIHLLHVLKGTKLGSMYEEGEYTPISEEEYVASVCDIIEVMPETTCIARLTGDGIAKELLAPMWSIKKMPILNDIDKELKRRGTYQGIYA